MVDKHSNVCKSVKKAFMLNKTITKICVLKPKLTAQTVQTAPIPLGFLPIDIA